MSEISGKSAFFIVDNFHEVDAYRLRGPTAMYNNPDDLKLFRALRRQGLSSEAAENTVELVTGAKRKQNSTSGASQFINPNVSGKRANLPYYHNNRRF